MTHTHTSLHHLRNRQAPAFETMQHRRMRNLAAVWPSAAAAAAAAAAACAREMAK
jgi:mevalonate pyrophosphate decarboxylase